MDAKIRITVLRRTLNEKLVQEFGDSPWHPCERLADGQVFISEHARMPEGFCSWAWADIHKIVLTLARGGDFLGVRPGVFITCCTDGFRPVLFKVERLTDKKDIGDQ